MGALTSVGKARRRSNQFRCGSPLCICFGLFVVILIFLAIILGVELPGIINKKQSATILLPLYIYPSAGMWDPLYTAAAQYPSLQFVVVVDPNGGSVQPVDAQYAKELPKLNNYSNIMTIGYVPTAQATRNITDVLQDIDTYANWPSASPSNYSVHGIFFDEAPIDYSEEAVSFMKQVDDHVKQHQGFNDKNMIVHNPGTIPTDHRLFEGADVIVVYEGPYSNYSSGRQSQQLQWSLGNLTSNPINNYQRQNFSYMFSGVPTNWTVSSLTSFVNSVLGGAQWIFVTDKIFDQTQNVYGSWGSNWADFVKVMASS